MNAPELDHWLKGATPNEWLEQALLELPTLLLDHAHCERKAAHTALLLIKRHPQQHHWLKELSKIAREELRHFELVLELLKQRCIPYETMKAGQYIGHLFANTNHLNTKDFATHELLVASLVEARSCERFRALAPILAPTEPTLAAFYDKLYLAEMRHFQIYLHWAYAFNAPYVETHLDKLLNHENTWIQQDDSLFRFHSGAYQKNQGQKNTCTQR